MRTALSTFLSVVVVLLCCQSAWAGIKISPVNVRMSHKVNSVTIGISNTSDRERTVQFTPFAWSQDQEGKDLLQETKELVVFPRLLILSPGDKKFVRVGHQFPAPLSTEKSYKLSVDQVSVGESSDTKPAEGIVLNLNLRFLIPVMIRPELKKGQVEFKRAELDGDMVQLWIQNKGNTYFSFKTLSYALTDGAGGELLSGRGTGLVLTGHSGKLSIAVPPESVTKLHSVSVTVPDLNISNHQLVIQRPDSTE